MNKNNKRNLTARRILLTLLWAYLTLACGWGVTVLENRRVAGLLLIPMLIFAVLFVRALKRLMNDRVQQAIERALGRALRWLFHPAAVVATKLASWLGIGRWRGWGEDERTFLGRTKEKETRHRRRLRNDQKWADQTDNRARVRFLYIEYMIKRIRAGYLFRRQLTPDEIAGELPLEEEEKVLFDTYTQARYARQADISDETVETLARVTAKK